MRTYWWQKAFRALGLTVNRKRQPHVRKRLHIELLEDRLAPATFAPTTFSDLTISSPADVNSQGQIVDQGNAITLRSAVIAANASSDPTNAIDLAAGTYQLTIVGNAAPGGSPNDFDPTKGDLNVDATGLTITGAGPGATIIQQTTFNDRVFDVNDNFANIFNFTVENLTIEGGRDTTTDGGGGAIYSGAQVSGLTDVENVQFLDNQSTGSGSSGGGAILNQGGDLAINDSTFGDGTGPNANSTTSVGGAIAYDSYGTIGTFTLTNSTFNDNIANGNSGSVGGAIDIDASNGGATTAQITGADFTHNSATADDGGAIAVDAGDLTVTTSNFDSNSAGGNGLGGALRSDGDSTLVSDSRFVNNTASAGPGQTLEVGADATLFTANDNWWGANSGPGANDLGSDAGAPPIAATTWLQLRNSASPSTMDVGQTSTVTADLYGQNTGGMALAGSLNGLPAFPVPAATIFGNSQLGTLSSASTQFINGVATATYTAGATAGTGSVDATADSQTITADITVIAPNAMTVALVGAALTVTDTTAAGANDNVTLQTDGAQFIINNPVSILSTTIPGATVSLDKHTVFVPFNVTTTVTATTPIDVNTLGGNDKLTVDWSLGNFQSAITYDGGSGSNSLAIKGAFQTETETFTNTGPGNTGFLQLDDGADPAEMVTYSDLAPVDMTGSTAANLVFNLPSGGTGALLGDDGTAGNGISEISNTGGTPFETTTFVDPTNSLTVNRGNAADTLSIAALPDFTAGLTVGSAGSSFATISANAGLTLNSGAADLSLFGATINLNPTATITTTNAQTYTGAVVLQANTTLSAGSTGVNFNGTVDDAAANKHSLTVTGNAVFDGIVGATELATLHVTGTTNINTTAITTGGTQQYDSAAIIGATTILTGSTITFGSTLDDATANTDALTVSGSAIFTGAVGVTTAALGSLEVTGVSAINGGAVQTGGTQKYDSAATIGATPTTLTGSTVTFGAKLDDGNAAGTDALTVTGNAVFGGAVGASAALQSVTTSVTGTTTIEGGSVKTSGDQTYNNPVTITADSVLTDSGSGIVFNSTLDGDGNGPWNLTTTTTAVTAQIQFNNTVGGNNPLKSLTINDAGAADSATGAIEGAGTTFIKQGSGAFTLSNTNTYTGATTISAGTLLVNGSTAAASAVAVNGGTLGGDGTVAGAVTVNAGGTINPGAAGAVGTLAVGSLAFNGGAYQADLDPSAGTADQIVTTGAINLADATQGVFSLNVLNATPPAASTVFTFIKNNGAGAIVNPPLVNATENGNVSINGQTERYTYAGGPGANNFTLTVTGPLIATGTNLVLRMSGTNLQVLNNGVVIDARPFAGVTSVTLNGVNNMADTATIDYTFGGTFIIAGGITYNGGAGTPSSSLTIKGGTFGTDTYNYTSAHNGTVQLGAGNPLITYTNLTPLTNTGTAANIVFNLPAGTVGAALEDDGVANNNTSELASTNATFETTTFTDPTSSLTVNAGGGTDTISTLDTNNNVPFSGDFNAALTINGSAATDTVNLNALTLGNGGTNSGAVSVTASTINVLGAIDTSAGSAGNVTLAAGRNIVVSASGGIKTSSGNINLQANPTGLTAGNFSGIEVNGAGISSTGSGTISLTGDGGIDAATGSHDGLFTHNGAVIQATGTGSVTLTGAGGLGTSNNIGIDIQDAGTKVTSTTGALTISGTGGTASGGGNQGVNISGGHVRSTGAGTVSITASSSGAGNAPALFTDAASSISAAANADDITLTSNNGATVAATVTTPGGLLLDGTAAGAFTLANAANSVVRLAATLSGALSFTDGTALTVGTVFGINGISAGANAVSLTDSTSIGQTAVGVITGGLLTTSSATGTNLSTATNAVTSFNASNSTSGNISLNNSAATLTVTGLSEVAGGSVTINNAGAVNFPNALSGDYNLIDTSTGLTTFSAAVGSPTALASVSIANDTALDGSGVATTGSQTYSGNVTVGAASVTLSHGGTLTIGSATGAGTLTLGGNTLIDAPVGAATGVITDQLTGSGTLTGGGASVLTITIGSVMRRVVDVAAGTTVSISGVTITGGLAGAANGGGILNDGTLTLASSSVIVNSATNGGGIFSDGTLNLDGDTIGGSAANKNTATSAGGGIGLSAGTISFINHPTSIAFNTAGTDGGGIAVASTFTNSVSLSGLVSILDNSAGRNGGGIDLAGGATSTFTTPTFADNTANSGLGGAINVDATFTNTLNLNGTTIGGSAANTNSAQNGGGIAFAGAGTLQLTGATVSFNGAAQKGGGLFQSAGTVTLDSSHIDHNTAIGNGGGIDVSAGAFQLTAGSTVDSNTSTTGNGGGIDLETGAGLATASASTVAGNAATVGSGGGINLESGYASTLTLNGATIGGASAAAGNSAGASGGGIAMASGIVNFITGTTTVRFNVAAGDGGGLDATGGTLTFNVATSVTNNTATAGNGGGIACPAGTVTLPAGSLVNDNTATAGLGGGIDATTVNLTGASVDGNIAGSLGGGINAGTVNATGSDISSNKAGSHGGGINAGTIDITSASTVDSNKAAGFGGGINAGGGTLSSSTVDSNTSGGFGGGVDITGTGLTVTSSTIDSNNAAFTGGGIFFGGTGTLAVDPSHIDNNTAAGDGGGILVSSGVLTLSAASTVNGNTSTFGNGGGIAIEGGTGHAITGSTIAGNTADLAGGGVYDLVGTLTIDSTTVGGATAATKNSAGSSGGGIAIAGGTVTLQNVTQVEGNSAVMTGGGINVSSGALILDDATIGGATAAAGNSAGTSGGGIALSAGSLTFSTAASTIEFNTAASDGGGIEVTGAGTLTVTAAITVTNNTATAGNGGGINFPTGTVSLPTGSLVSTNQAHANGGGINAGTVMLTGAIANGNTAGGTGGGINAGSGSATDSGLSANVAGGSGGGINVTGTSFTLTGSSILGGGVPQNAGGTGGGINFVGTGTLTLNPANVNNNVAAGDGGGIFIGSGALDLAGTGMTASPVLISGNVSTAGSGGGIAIEGGNGHSISFAIITQNTAKANGGGVYVSIPAASTITLTSDTIGGPSAAAGNTAAIGGGLDVAGGAVNASASTFSFNTASTSGGGLQFSGAATTGSLTNDTISNNSGAGIQIGSGTLTMLFDTVAFNTAGGVNNTGGAVKPQNSLFASNTGFDYQGTLSSQGNNLFQITPASGAIAMDLVDQAAMLATLANYGGNTETIALLPGSAALGAAASVAVVVDERGEARPASPDIGAFQSQGFTTASVSGPTPGTEVKTLIENDFASPFAIAVTANAKAPAIASVAGGTITFVAAPSPAFTVGEAVFYQAGSPGIGGLTDGGTYYVANPTSTTIQLLSAPNATSILPLTAGTGTFYLEPVQGGRVVFTATPVAGAVGSAASSGIAGDDFDASQVGNTLTLASTPNLVSGETVVYDLGGPLVGNIGGLTPDSFTAPYFVEIPNAAAPNVIQLSTTLGGAPIDFTSNGTAATERLLPSAKGLSIAAGTSITLGAADFNNGDLVTFHANGVPVAGLANGASYYVIVTNPGVSPEIIRLVQKTKGAAGPAITGLGAFNGTQSFTLALPATGSALPITITNFAKVVSSINFTSISASGQASFLNGEPVIYNAGVGPAIGGLTSGNLYYVVSANNATAVQLSKTKGGAAISFTTPTTATLQQSLLPADLVMAVNSSSTITLANAPSVGAGLIFDADGAASLGLSPGQTYYVIAVTASKVTLALTPGGAAITTLTPVGPVAGGQSFEPAAQGNPTFDFLPSAATVSSSTITFAAPGSNHLTNGEPVVYDNGGGANITGLAEGHTYFVVAAGANSLSLSNTLGGPAITGLAAPAGVPTLNSLTPLLTYTGGTANMATPVLANSVSNPPGTPYPFTASAGGKNAGASIAWTLFNQSVTSLVYSATPHNTKSNLNDVTFGGSPSVKVTLLDQDGQLVSTSAASVSLSAVYSANGSSFTAYTFDTGTGTTSVSPAAGVASFTPNLQIWTSRYTSAYYIQASYKNPDGAAVPLGDAVTPPFLVLPYTVAIAAGNFGGFDQTVLNITIASSVRGPVRLIDYTIGGTTLKTNQVEVIAFDFDVVGKVQTITFATAYNGPITLSAFQNNSGAAGAAVPLSYTGGLAYNGGNLGYMTGGTITLSNVTPTTTGTFFLDSETDSGVSPVGFIESSTAKTGYSFNRSNLGRQRGR